MSILDRFENAVINEASLDLERRQQHAQNANPNSHKDFFANKRPRKLSNAVLGGVARTEEEGVILSHVDVAATRQNVRRGKMLKEMVMQSLTERVQEPTGYLVMAVHDKDWQKMHEEYRDAEKIGRQGELSFVPFSVYSQNLLYHREGTLREKPIRPLLKNEVGQFLSGPHAGKIIVLKEDSPEDDGKIRVQVSKDLVNTSSGELIDSVLEIAQK